MRESLRNLFNLRRGEQAPVLVAGLFFFCILTALMMLRPALEASEADWLWVMSVNLHGIVNCCRVFAARMKGQGVESRIVNTASMAALLGNAYPGLSLYTASKHACLGFSDGLRTELAPHGIVVACAYPPDTRTPGFDAENELKPPETERISAAIKPREAEHVAKAIVRGIEKDRLVITADAQTAALARGAGILGPYVRWSSRACARRASAWRCCAAGKPRRCW